MHEPVALDERRRISSEQLAERVVEGVRREPGIQDRECCAETAFKNGIAVVRVAAFGCRLADGNLRTVQDGIVEAGQPFEGGFFDDGFGKATHQWKRSFT